jgi:hypothetical protein
MKVPGAVIDVSKLDLKHASSGNCLIQDMNAADQRDRSHDSKAHKPRGQRAILES